MIGNILTLEVDRLAHAVKKEGEAKGIIWTARKYGDPMLKSKAILMQSLHISPEEAAFWVKKCDAGSWQRCKSKDPNQKRQVGGGRFSMRGLFPDPWSPVIVMVGSRQLSILPEEWHKLE